MVVCARKAVCEAPDTGARDQYIPLAGAGSTSGADFRSGRGGKDVCGPRGARIGVGFLGAAGEEAEDPSAGRLDAIAEVERMFRGRRRSGFSGAGVEVGAGAGV